MFLVQKDTVLSGYLKLIPLKLVIIEKLLLVNKFTNLDLTLFMFSGGQKRSN